MQSVSTHSWWPILYLADWSQFDWHNHVNILLNQLIDEDLFIADDTISHDYDDILRHCAKELKAKMIKAVNAMSLTFLHYLGDTAD